MTSVLVIGATSAIAEAIQRLMAAKGHTLYLVARDVRRIEALATDLRVRGAMIAGLEPMDVTDFGAHEAMIARAEAALGTVDIAFIAHGTLPDQRACEESAERALDEFATNATATIALLTRLAARMETRRRGTLAVVSSVAGDRGRASNYVYGAAKAAVNAFLGGLRQRLTRSGVAVVTIKPGFVDTPMTAAFRKGPLWATPAAIAPAILRAIERGTPVLYVPWFWRWIMAVIRAIPESLFRRMTL